MLYDTTATTHLGAIRRNLERIRARVTADRPDRRVLLAVKADAYGHGAAAVATMAQATGSADWFGVATVPEALELRDAGVTLPIMKLSPAVTAGEREAAVASDITLTVVDADTIDAAELAARKAGRTASVHLKVDTGMRRIGCEPDVAADLCRRIDAAGNLSLGGVYSHLPVSDVESGRSFTAGQIAEYRRVIEACEDARGPIPLKHLANSGGVLMHPDSWFDMVRPGVLAYGYLPDPDSEPTVDVEPGISWTTYVTFVKRVRAGESVSYGRTWSAPRDTWIATVSVGYADGFSRLFSNNGRVLIRGRSYPIVGRVSMDQTMVDLGPDLPAVAVGDRVVLLGTSGHESIGCAELAARMGTITYEVTCLIGPRVTREFDGD